MNTTRRNILGSTMNSVNIHEITEIEVNNETLDAVGRPFTVRKYKFTDVNGNAFTVNAFLKEEEK